jgi:hypothetical protein
VAGRKKEIVLENCYQTNKHKIKVLKVYSGICHRTEEMLIQHFFTRALLQMFILAVLTLYDVRCLLVILNQKFKGKKRESAT